MYLFLFTLLFSNVICSSFEVHYVNNDVCATLTDPNNACVTCSYYGSPMWASFYCSSSYCDVDFYLDHECTTSSFITGDIFSGNCDDLQADLDRYSISYTCDFTYEPQQVNAGDDGYSYIVALILIIAIIAVVCMLGVAFAVLRNEKHRLHHEAYHNHHHCERDNLVITSNESTPPTYTQPPPVIESPPPPVQENPNYLQPTQLYSYQNPHPDSVYGAHTKDIYN